jgi:hypothetical protein
MMDVALNSNMLNITIHNTFSMFLMEQECLEGITKSHQKDK